MSFNTTAHVIVGRIVFVQGLITFGLDHKVSVQPTLCVSTYLDSVVSNVLPLL